MILSIEQQYPHSWQQAQRKAYYSKLHITEGPISNNAGSLWGLFIYETEWPVTTLTCTYKNDVRTFCVLVEYTAE